MKNKTSFFVCPGASKAGTSSLYDILKFHPELNLTNIKETRFFVNEEQLKKGKEFYLNTYFHQNDKLKGEICPQYMSSDRIPERIYNILGSDTKIILMLRNPVDRLISHFLMKTRTFENKSLQEVLDQTLHYYEDFDNNDREYINKHLKYTLYGEAKNDKNDALGYRYSRYIYPGLYADIIEEYFKYFSRENIKIILFEEFIIDINKGVKDITDFLNIDDKFDYKPDQRSNKRKTYKNSISKKIRNSTFLVPAKYKRKIANLVGINKYEKFKKTLETPFVDSKKIEISEEERDRIYKFYLPNIIRLEELLNMNLTIWKK
ncbi:MULTISPECIES: sulfotransferase domain-containing protein [Mesonia]|uniref:Uncharacterized protein n=1 Tax=Mesonia oceanica TaxID=2687242 RepID=A0AC61Y5H4_9FLAO|nr:MULTISPECIES: sulfotransferase domain-containing protein [Mesonia]MAN28951.1 hypothetical protein [Mesonia sp.]MAQ42731.1 hypothetical protein [Mesonia sp.]MBJ99269.1 hypothetical protein [Flavobacteriaceae bacterium]VVU99731.1 hypothetical protein FVB9532_00988 [Mesonia oceanica]|tara:strand:- start:23581 stop:24537 length:957 start_codon:yes stop_codon:yes gene_type:complete